MSFRRKLILIKTKYNRIRPPDFFLSGVFSGLFAKETASNLRSHRPLALSASRNCSRRPSTATRPAGALGKRVGRPVGDSAASDHSVCACARNRSGTARLCDQSRTLVLLPHRTFHGSTACRPIRLVWVVLGRAGCACDGLEFRVRVRRELDSLGAGANFADVFLAESCAHVGAVSIGFGLGRLRRERAKAADNGVGLQFTFVANTGFEFRSDVRGGFRGVAWRPVTRVRRGRA